MPTPDLAMLGLFALGLVVGIVLVVGGRALRGVGGRSGTLGGVWEQTLLDSRGGVRARDRVVCRQSGAELRGTIRRVEPSVEDYKEWRFSGHVEGSLLSCVLWGADPERTPGDAGTLQLALGEPGRVEGFLAKRPLSQNGASFTATTLETRLTWARPAAPVAVTVAPGASDTPTR